MPRVPGMPMPYPSWVSILPVASNSSPDPHRARAHTCGTPPHAANDTRTSPGLRHGRLALEPGALTANISRRDLGLGRSALVSSMRGCTPANALVERVVGVAVKRGHDAPCVLPPRAPALLAHPER